MPKDGIPPLYLASRIEDFQDSKTEESISPKAEKKYKCPKAKLRSGPVTGGKRNANGRRKTIAGSTRAMGVISNLNCALHYVMGNGKTCKGQKTEDTLSRIVQMKNTR